MIDHSSIRKFTLASACLLALASAQAQTDDGTVVISGQLSVNTCKLVLIDSNGFSDGIRSVELGTINPPAGTITPGDLLGTQKSINFRLTNSAGKADCVISGGLGQWNLALDLQANQVNRDAIASKPFLTNQASTNAAGNIGVALFNNKGTQYTALATGAGYLGTKLTEAGGVFNTTGIALSAQFMATSASAPTPGAFNATVPLLIVYN